MEMILSVLKLGTTNTYFLQEFTEKMFIDQRKLSASNIQPRKFYIRRNNKKVDSIETRRRLIAHLLP